MVSNSQQLTFAIKAVNEASAALKDIDGDLGKLGESADTSGGKFEGMGKKAGLAIGGLATVAGAGLVGVGIASFNLSRDIQSATNELETQLGVTTEEAERLAGVAEDVYGNNFASSIQEASTTISTAFKTMGDVGDEELQGIAENAHRLQDVFGTETTESISAAKTLMENFGLSSDEAFDMIAEGYQKGLDRSGDFLQSVNEYSTQFKNGGASVEEFFSLMESGAAGGVLGVDKAADVFKEFNIRILDGSKMTSDAVSQLFGDQTDAFLQQLATGQITSAEAFAMVQEKMAGLEDDAQRMQVGVGLMGAQFEDLGLEAAMGLSMMGDGFSDAAGSMDGLDAKYRTLGDTIESWKRRAILALTPVADKINEFIVVHGPSIEKFFDEKVIPAIDGFVTAAGEGFQWFKENALPVLQEIGAEVQVQFAKFMEYYESDIKPAFDNIVAGVTWVVEQFEEHWPTIEKVVKPVMEQIENVVTTAFEVITGIIGIFIDLLGGDFAGAWNGAKELVGTVATFFVDSLRNSADLIKGLVGVFKEAGKALIQGLWDAMADLFREHVVPWFEALPGRMVSAIGNLGRILWDKGKQIIQSLIDGMLEMKNKIPNPASWIPGGGVVSGFVGGFVPGFADGGLVTRPTLAMIGERGPEMVVPLTGANAGRVPGVGNVGGTTVHIHVAGSVVTLRELAYELKRLGPVV